MMGIWNDLWSLFFPKCCILCGKRLMKGEEHLCFQCLSGLPRTQMHLQPENEMEKCFWGKLPVEKASAFLYYTKGGDVRKLLFDFKYYGNSALGRFLGTCMASELFPSGFFEGVDCVVPVPLHPKKEKKRGFNQSEILAEGIASVLDIPVAKHLLVRNQYTETQTRKGNYNRWMNVKDVFDVSDVASLKGKHILLVDDVMTTGATMVACADAMNEIPGLRISVLALALAGDI